MEYHTQTEIEFLRQALKDAQHQIRLLEDLVNEQDKAIDAIEREIVRLVKALEEYAEGL